MEKGKQPSHKYEEDLFLNNECSKNFKSNFSQIKLLRGRIIDLNHKNLIQKLNFI